MENKDGVGVLQRKQPATQLVRHSPSSSHILTQDVLELLRPMDVRGGGRQQATYCLAARKGA